MSAHCGWRMSRARHTTTCALARHRSECEFHLERFVVQLYLCCTAVSMLYSCIYMLFVFCCTAVSVCCLYIYTLVYFLFMSFAHSRQFLHLYLSISVRIVYSFVYFLHGIFILFISIALFNIIFLYSVLY